MLVNEKTGKIYYHSIILKEDGTKEVTQKLPEDKEELKEVMSPYEVLNKLTK